MSLTHSERIPISELGRFPYIGVLTYPKRDARAARARIRQLGELGVETVIFEGRTRVGNLGLVGIGTVGLVVRAEARGKILALKIRRTDANRESMRPEYDLTEMANKVGVGPRVVGWTKDFILMQHVGGVEVEDWLREVAGRGTRDRVGEMVRAVLNQCRKLDIINLDHGQLSNLRKHLVITGGGPVILDFESAGLQRKVRNVTTAGQYLLVGGKVSSRVRRLLGLRKLEPILGALREYKKDMNDRNYALLIATVTRRRRGTPST